MGLKNEEKDMERFEIVSFITSFKWKRREQATRTIEFIRQGEIPARDNKNCKRKLAQQLGADTTM